MRMNNYSWEETVKFHGHSCMGLAIGYRVAEAALSALENKRDVDEEFVAVVENDSCAVDAIQVITGCTLGKGNLIYKDYGKQVYTFALRPGGKAVRIALRTRENSKQTQMMELRAKMARGEATSDDESLFNKLHEELIDEFLSYPPDEIIEIKEIEFDYPEKARIFKSVECSCCGEKVMEPRARIKEGKITCIPCSVKYTRGWGSDN
jgi:formylmethanofuran dehydrogenase subunit E